MDGDRVTDAANRKSLIFRRTNHETNHIQHIPSHAPGTTRGGLVGGAVSYREDREADAAASPARMTRSELINEVESQALAWKSSMPWCPDKTCRVCKSNAADLAQFKSNIDKLREKLGVKI